jgi:Uma2 family endonuclease
MTIKAQLLTIADWDSMPHGDGNRYEIIEGELFKSDWPGLTHQRVLSNLLGLLGVFVNATKIGEVVPNPPLILSDDTAVLPDVVYFTNEQCETLIRDDRLVGPPTLIVEVVSPGIEDVARDCKIKFDLYFKHAVPEYWLVYPKTFTVERHVYQGSPLLGFDTLRCDDSLSTTILPGFSCKVSEIFEPI